MVYRELDPGNGLNRELSVGEEVKLYKRGKEIIVRLVDEMHVDVSAPTGVSFFKGSCDLREGHEHEKHNLGSVFLRPEELIRRFRQESIAVDPQGRERHVEWWESKSVRKSDSSNRRKT